MKKMKILLATIILSYSCVVNAQNAYYDALKIDYFVHQEKAIEKQLSLIELRIQEINVDVNLTPEEKTKCLKYDSEQRAYIEAIIEFNETPFLKPLELKALDLLRSSVVGNSPEEFSLKFPELCHPGSGEKGFNIEKFEESSSVDSMVFTGSPFNALGGAFLSPSFQSMVIDGAAKFLAEEFKEGITEVYIDKFRRKLEEIPELQVIFPKTSSFLSTANVFNYGDLGNDFKDAFQSDLSGILLNLRSYINQKPALKKTLQEKKIYVPFDFALSLSHQLMNGHHPVDILDYLESTYSTEEDFKSVVNWIRGVNLIQRNLQKVRTDEELENQFVNVWLELADLNKLNTPKKIANFVALIDHQDTYNVLGIDNGKIGAFYQELVIPIIDHTKQIDQAFKNESLTSNDILKLLENTLAILHIVEPKLDSRLGYIRFEVKQPDKDAATLQDSIGIIDLTERTIDLYRSIVNADYGYVVTNGCYITEKILLASGVENTHAIRIVQSISKYGGFMVDVVTADDSEAIKTAIKNNVTSFSYRDKRTSSVSFTLSAHPGVYGGTERLVVTDEYGLNFGITAPIGFELAFGEKSKEFKSGFRAYAGNKKVKYLRGWGYGFFFSFADIGAAFNYRLLDAESELPEELTFKQVFSPGCSFNIHFRNTPLTLGMGFQYTPELRKVTTDGIETSTATMRYMVRLSWDIPLIKFWAR